MTAARAQPVAFLAEEIIRQALAGHDGDAPDATAAAVMAALVDARLLAGYPYMDRPVAVPKPRPAAHERVASRGDRPRCPRPEKAAYNLADPEEARLMRRRCSDGLEQYLCRCGWIHLGHPAPVGVADHADQVELGPIGWVRQRRHVTLVTGQGDSHAAGRVVGYYDAPTVLVDTDRGRITWRADMTVPADA